MIDRISINGTMYAVTPVPEGEQPSGSTVTVDGVTYLIGTAITAPAEMAQQAIEKIQVNGVLYDIADVEAVEAEKIRAKEAEQKLEDATKANSTAIAQLFETVTWDTSSNLNNFINAGVYNIKGTRQNAADNLPITNTGADATIAARLIVTVAPEGATTYRHSVGQTLILSNAEGKETKIYTRNGNRTSYDGGVSYTIEWSAWATQQTNINVGQVDNLDNLTDNGIYSGVWTKGSYNAYPLTFVCIVINDYFVGVTPRRISQFVYGLSKMDGSVVCQSRVWDDSKSAWGDWEILNKNQISQMIGDRIKSVNDTITTITENLAAMIDTEATRAQEAEDGIKSNALQTDTFTVDANWTDTVNLYMRTLKGVTRIQPIPAATTEKAGVMSANDKQKLEASAESFEFFAEKERVGLEISANSGNLSETHIPAATAEKAGVMSANDKVALSRIENRINYYADKWSDVLLEAYFDSEVFDLSNCFFSIRKTATERQVSVYNGSTLMGNYWTNKSNELVESGVYKLTPNVTGITIYAAVDFSTMTTGTTSYVNIRNNKVFTLEYSSTISAYIAKQLALRSLFIAAGALYNDSNEDIQSKFHGDYYTHKAKHYFLNGIGDLTEEDMLQIYDERDAIFRLNKGRVLQGNTGIRTIFTGKMMQPGILYSRDGNDTTFKYYTFSACSNLERLYFSRNVISEVNTVSEWDIIMAATEMISTFKSCTKLKRISPINVRYTTNFQNTFYGCSALETVRIFNLNANISFSDSPLINKQSLLFMINKSIANSAITITLHPDAYATLSDDAEIVSALEAKPLVTLVSA